MDNPRIFAVEWGTLEGRRPRHAGSNARLGAHGVAVHVPLARLITEDGAWGFGRCRASLEEARQIVGRQLDDLFSPTAGAKGPGLAFDLPLWDLAARRENQPVYALAAQAVGRPVPTAPLQVPCYDTSLYFDDLHLADTRAAAALLAQEARQGYAQGHRAFKIKVGRGARHMPLEEGTRRDIAVVWAVREAVGPDCPLMLDANNGYNLNLAKRVLRETSGADIFWLEEAFHEDAVLYRDLKAWVAAQGLSVRIADGEGQASPNLLEWAREGVVDVVQYDIFSYGFTRWLALARQLDDWGVYTAPHHYGGHVGNHVSAHLAAAVGRFAFVEWDEASTPGLDTSTYVVQEGRVHVPPAPGFGLELDLGRFAHAVRQGGFSVTA